MKIIRVRENFDCEKYILLKMDLFGSLYEIFDEVINDFDSTKDYVQLINDCFLKFKNKSGLKLNFEFSYGEFRIFEKYHFSSEDWIIIYKLFNSLINKNDELTVFIKLFYYGLLYVGPFWEEVECLYLSNSLLSLMSDEVKKLFWAFDEFFDSQNPDLMVNLVNISEDDSIPIYITCNLAKWVSEHVCEHQDELKKYEDISLELYMVAFKKIFNKYLIDDYDVLEYDGLRLELDTSTFSEEQIEMIYSKIFRLNGAFRAFP